ncbi:MAG: NAD(P)-dependent oxidoreductase [Pseudomonadota bacterium]|nr:NAD(P)-dependent oxidoreductase [Pseudomonadota bacterium]
MHKGKILFTGANGFIGRHLVPLLERDGWIVLKPRSHDISLDIESDVNNLFQENEFFDAIIHAAIIGGKRNSQDAYSTFYLNMRMFENLFKHIDKCGIFINFDSGASFSRPAPLTLPGADDLGKSIPDDIYGFSKYCIAKKILMHQKGFNLRIWGCFGSLEEPQRFFASNVKNYICKKKMTINKDRLMDFIYIEDLYLILKYVLLKNEELCERDINCVYKEKYFLTQIADIINNLDGYRVDTKILDNSIDHPYCGKHNNIPIDLIGLKKGIRICWEQWKEV